jgi:hypothetical protein
VNDLVHQKDLQDKSNRDFREWTVDHFAKLARKNPIRFLSRGRFFHYDEVNRVFYLDPGLEDHLGPDLAAHVRDILDYRTVQYFRRRYRDDE